MSIAKKILCCCLYASVFMFKQANAQIATPSKTGYISLQQQLSALYDVSQLPRYSTAVAGQASTYDRQGGNDDGFNGTYSFIRRNADSSLVVFEAAGNGVITRIATPTPSDDTLDIYIGDTTRPLLSLPFSALFSGSFFPFVKPLCGNQLGGYYCYYPIMFNNGCKIVCRAKTMQFYQIQYQLYPKQTTVQNFSTALNTTEKQALSKVAEVWGGKNILNSPAANQLHKTSVENIGPGETKTIFTSNTGGRITGIELDGADSYAGLYKDIDIKITWDGENTPAVYCPLADFFGYAFGSPAMQGLLLGSAQNKNYCYYPMPFDNNATIQLIYRADASRHNQAVKHIQATIYYTTQKRDAQTEGKFYTSWQGNNLPPTGQPQIFLQTRGRGHYVGTVLQAQGLRPGMTSFFEGDDSTVVDGIPAIHGTGSEDYFNGGWYAFPDRWSGRYSLPLHGALDYSLPYCRTGGYRLYLADKIPFTKSIYQSMEHGPEGNNVPAMYTSLGLYYCSTPPATYIKPNNSVTKVYVADTLTLYPQLLDFNIWGEATAKPAWAYDTGGQSFVFTVNSETRLRFPLTGILSGHYKLFVDFVKQPEGCDFSIWQKQSQVSSWLTTLNNTSERVEQQYLGEIEVNESQNTLTLQFKTNGKANSFFLNRFILVKQ